jgi:hypothetical protein
MWAIYLIFIYQKANNRPLGENSANLVTLNIIARYQNFIFIFKLQTTLIHINVLVPTHYKIYNIT